VEHDRLRSIAEEHYEVQASEAVPGSAPIRAGPGEGLRSETFRIQGWWLSYAAATIATMLLREFNIVRFRNVVDSGPIPVSNDVGDHRHQERRHRGPLRRRRLPLALQRRHRQELKVADLPPGDRIVRRIAEKAGEFEHGEPADHLLRHRDEMLSQLSTGTLDRFEKLIERINKKMPTT
jgi:hypothetical protein